VTQYTYQSKGPVDGVDYPAKGRRLKQYIYDIWVNTRALAGYDASGHPIQIGGENANDAPLDHSAPPRKFPPSMLTAITDDIIEEDLIFHGWIPHFNQMGLIAMKMSIPFPFLPNRLMGPPDPTASQRDLRAYQRLKISEMVDNLKKHFLKTP
jgi:hypothetical protein